MPNPFYHPHKTQPYEDGNEPNFAELVLDTDEATTRAGIEADLSAAGLTLGNGKYLGMAYRAAGDNCAQGMCCVAVAVYGDITPGELASIDAIYAARAPQ